MKPGSLQRCQVVTPPDVVSFMWQLARERRSKIGHVVDLAAGDGRFARGGRYNRYVGYEIDRSRHAIANLSAGASIRHVDAFAELDGDLYDLAIGNPPYVKSSELNAKWREKICTNLGERLGLQLARNANLFVYFLFLGLIRTKPDGLSVQLVPYEWVTRPSAKALRNLIERNGWSVDVYRFRYDIFDRVMTTASITVIDKATKVSSWRHFELSKNFEAHRRRGPSGSRAAVLPYVRREDDSYCLRGLSPGGQDIFVLTEHDRVFYRLNPKHDLYPAVTTLRTIPDSLITLDRKAFDRHFVQDGARCWLVRSDVAEPSARVKEYLSSVPTERWSRYSTCTSRPRWWQFKSHPVPPILMACGFREAAPKVITNEAGAVACGSVYGVFAQKGVAALVRKLRHFDFGSRVVSHSNGLKKVEVNQVNAALQAILKI